MAEPAVDTSPQTGPAEGALVPADAESLHALGLELDDRRQRIRELEALVAKKDAAVRRAREEHQLVRELHSINMLALRKIDNDSSRTNKLLISPESLAQVIALEDAIKIETQRTTELQREATLLEQQAQRTATTQDEVARHIDVVKDTTGWERHEYGARGYVNEENRFKEHQKLLTDLQREQDTLKLLTTQLTERIERQTQQLEERKDAEAQLVNAQAMLKAKTSELKAAIEEKRSLERISQRKEQIIEKTSKVDDYKLVKSLEGDKRVLHTELKKHMEAVLQNEKSVQAQEAKLHQLETRLLAINQFLAVTFADVEGSENFRPGVEPGQTEVPLAQFEEVQQQLANARFSLRDRDRKLEALDAKIEALEQKVSIIHVAQVSRTAVTAQEYQEMEREAALLRGHIDQIQAEFDSEHMRLEDENANLREVAARLR